MEIREFTKTDHQSIYNLIKEELGYKNINLETLSQRLKKMKKDPNYTVFVAVQNNHVVGFIGLMKGIAFEIEGIVIRIIALAVAKEYQGNNIGSLLLKHSEVYAKECQAAVITLNSGLNRLDAHQFYQKRGYIKKGYSFIKQCE